MTMSKFRAAPRTGHLERLKRVYGYVWKHRDGALRYRTSIPDMSDYPMIEHDWERSVYGEVTELVPEDIPEALGNEVVTITYVDANLLHDLITGRAVTGILHLVNQTPADWYCKTQATVETATFGAEFSAARVAVDQILDLRNTLRYLGVPVRRASYLFVDNESVTKNSVLPFSTLNKRHNILSYHRVREAVAGKIINLHWIPGSTNPADILSKHWDYAAARPHIEALLFTRGDTLPTRCRSDAPPQDVPKSRNST